jgi:hypothetical protein
MSPYKFNVGDIVKSVSNHSIVRVVVRANKRLNLDEHESIGVAECDIYAGKAININEIFEWSLPAYWELMTDEENLQRIIEEEVKKCS